MDSRKCTKCGREFKYPCELKRHLARKTPCQPILEYEDLSETEKTKKYQCKFCGHRFSQRSSLSRHINEKCKIACSEKGLKKLYEHTLRKTNSLETKLKQLQMQVGENVPEAAAAPGSINILNLQQHNSIHININVFGMEDCSHIDKHTVKCILDEVETTVEGTAEEKAREAMRKAARIIYNDAQHPENTTCYMTEGMGNDTMVHGEDGWTVRPYKKVAPTMANMAVSLLFNKQPFHEAERYEKVMFALREKEEGYKEDRHLRDILVDNSELVINTR